MHQVLISIFFLNPFSYVVSVDHCTWFCYLVYVSYVCKKLSRGGDGEGSKEMLKIKRRFMWYKQTLVCCLGVSVFNLILCLLSYFYLHGNVWSDGEAVTLLDLGLRTLSWGALAVYLHTRFFNSGEKMFPLLLRVWWGFYLAISCYCFAVDVFLHKRQGSLEIEWYLVSDVVSVFAGLFLCYVGFSRSDIQDVLEEPLLNGDSSSINNLETSDSRGGDVVTPFGNAGLFSILTFSWMNSLIASGNKKTLDLEDVPQLHGVDSVVGAFPAFKNKLESDCGRVTRFKLAKALFLLVWKEILWTALLALIHTLGSYVGPYLIDFFVQCLDGRGEFKNRGYILAFSFVVAKLAECLAQRHLLFRLQQIGTRLRAVTTTMIYNKSLTISCHSKQGHSSGEIINIMTIDANRIGRFSWFIHDPWLVMLQICLALLILYRNLGLGSVAGFVATVIVMSLNYPFGRLEERFQDKLMESKDKRMKTTTEILRNMRILKLQGWEMKFLSKILDLREIETQWLKKYLYTSVVITVVAWVTPTIVAVATFGTCMLIGVPLDSGKVLSALATFEILQSPIYTLPETVSMFIQTKVSLDRITSFLCLDDLQPNAIEKLPAGSSDTAIEIVDGNFSWDLSSPGATLKDINFKVFNGMKVAVCGTVGSGKSSLLSSILGELPKISGTLKLCGTKAYVAQSPWIQSGNIEENILFGEGMNRERYDKVLEACSLKKDLETLPFGDQTVIGERGINLSGGQKQRIQIARALYQDAQIYLFDDPFSAVDAHTGSHLFKEVLLGVLSSKTVIYVTHQVEFLSAADLILVMKDGRIAQAGKYDDILHSGSDFMVLVGAHKAALSVLDSRQAGPVSENEEKHSTDGIAHNEENKDSRTGKADEVAQPQAQLIQEEEREKGSVGFPIYWKYITTAYGGALVPFILLAQLLFQILQIGSTYWMAWATPASKDAKPVVSGSRLLIVYVSLVIGSSFGILARVMLLVTAGYKTATLLFNKLHLCIFRAPMSFFDATPSGRILNRASTDQSALEMEIPNIVGELAIQAITLLGIIAVMSQVAWQVFIVSIPVIAACIWYQQYYIPSARELSRLIGVCNAPVIQNFAETISGATTIRSFDKESRFQELNMRLTDAYSRPRFHNSAAMQWLCFRMDMLSSITFAFCLLLLVSFPERINPGLAVTYALGLHMTQFMLIYCFCHCENKLISVERILQYISIPAEPPLVIEAKRPDHSWPSHGEVDIINLQVRYAPHMPLVLRGLACTFPGGKKTGIVGRTGSGKSTLIQALFRTVEPAAGRIMIDNIDISLIGLHDLRSRLSIIPQDPTMFEGTVRSNLDPLEEYTDEQIWEALDKCQLGDEVRKKEMKLDSSVIENGENWSMGQRQLACLGRVLLKKSKVLVLDEATASVDTATDNLIQQTLRQHFSDSTVITIAHRITSVLDSDMVLVLSHGLIEECDSPARLLENKSSSFSRLVAEYTVRSNTKKEIFFGYDEIIAAIQVISVSIVWRMEMPISHKNPEGSPPFPDDLLPSNKQSDSNGKDQHKSSGSASCLESLLKSDEQSCSGKKDHRKHSGSAPCLDDLLHSGRRSCRSSRDPQKSSGPQKRLEQLLSQSGNKICADCGFPDPKWVSISFGVFICIKCSGIHRSLGVHLTKVLSIKLDEWTDEQVNTLIDLGGNTAANKKFEAFIPDDYQKPKPDASIEERSDFIRGKYEQKQFSNCDEQMSCPFPGPRSTLSSSSSSHCSPQDKKQFEKQATRHRIGIAFRNSWGRKDTEYKNPKKSSSLAGMVEFVGLIKVNVVKGTNLAVRDVVTSDPYVVLALGQQSVRTRVIKNNLNPIWNESLMLSIPEQIPPLKVFVYDKDKFTTDDFMGEAEIDIQPLVSAAKAYENSTITESMQLGKWIAGQENTLVKDGIISLADGKVKQEISLKLKNVERGVLEIELECVPLTQ
uniref:ABC-type xenobiotic transporter n=1 Tax=Salix viminalis TaxID=40686 RepID=A0A6N2JWM3_SALVM